MGEESLETRLRFPSGAPALVTPTSEIRTRMSLPITPMYHTRGDRTIPSRYDQIIRSKYK